MVAKRELDKSLATFELQLSHADIIDMMNDPQVLLDGGSVSASQILEIVSRRLNGSEVVLSKFDTTDTLVMRFSRCTTVDDVTPFIDVDIT